MDSSASLRNAFQRLIALRDFPHAEPKSCWKQFKPFPFGLVFVWRKRKALRHCTRRVPAQIPGLPQAPRLLIKVRAKQGLGELEEERARARRTPGLALLVSFSEAAQRVLGPGSHPALASHSPRLSLLPLSLPPDLLPRKRRSPLERADNVQPDTGRRS